MKISIVSKKKYPVVKRLGDEFDVVRKGEICIAIGGDGTFVHAAMRYDVPILPIHIDENGSSGFYSDVGTEDIDRVIESLKTGSYKIVDMANKLELIYKKRRYYAVNEVSLNYIRQEVSFRIYEAGRQGRHIYPFVVAGDGVVITGEVGSTAYNRSAMGPLLLSNKVMCITLLNTDGPYRNSLVVDSSSRIEVEVVKYSGILRHDGVDVGRVGAGGGFTVRTSDRKLRVVRFGFKSETLADKLERIMMRRMDR